MKTLHKILMVLVLCLTLAMISGCTDNNPDEVSDVDIVSDDKKDVGVTNTYTKSLTRTSQVIETSDKSVNVVAPIV